MNTQDRQLSTGLGKRLIVQDSLEAKAFDKLPIIDISSLNSPNLSDRLALADQIRDGMYIFSDLVVLMGKYNLMTRERTACMNQGFFYIAGHGIPDSTILQAFDQGKVFFAQPKEKKDEVHMNKGSSFRVSPKFVVLFGNCTCKTEQLKRQRSSGLLARAGRKRGSCESR